MRQLSAFPPGKGVCQFIYRILRNKGAGAFTGVDVTSQNGGFGLKFGQLLRELWPFL